jgi:hypothetical protein
MKRIVLLLMVLLLLLLTAACGGSDAPAASDAAATPAEGASTAEETSSEAPVKLEILEAVFAHGLDEDMGPVDPGNVFQPGEPIYLSIKLKGAPKEGVVTARFMYEDQEIAEASVDIGEAFENEGLLFVIGGNTQVGFTLTPSAPFPPGDAYKAKVYLNGKPAGEFGFVIAGEDAQAPATDTEATETQTSESTSAERASSGGEEHEVTIHAFWYAQDPATGEAVGGVSPVRVSVRPSRNKELRVGFYEEEVGGLGPMWQAAGWTAVVVASQVLNIDPRDYEFAYSVGGRIDGPSAGAYMTIATLAALQGHPVAQDVFMTGTINPDGTIGPVGGVPHKVAGAAENGARMVLIPAGLRYDQDQNTGEMVDVVEVGRNLGVEVREVSTIYEAYPLITGQELPRQVVTGASPQLPPRAFDRTRAKAQEWLARYQDARGRINSLVPEIIDLFAAELEAADETAVSADNALQQGLAGVAYNRAVNAAIQAQIWLLMGEMVQRYAATEDLNTVVEYLTSTQTALAERDAVLDLLATEKPRSASDYVALFDAYTSIGQAEGLVVLADSAIQNLVKNADTMSDEDFLAQLMEIAAYYVLARDFVQLARDSVDIGFGYGEPVEIPEERVRAMAELLRHAADANLAYFDSIIVDQVAEAWGVHPNVARNMVMNADWNYLFALASQQGVQSLSTGLGNPAQVDRLQLGASVSNYALTSALVAKHYSLGAQMDDSGNVVALSQERALADMLDLADQRARELIARNQDDPPVLAILYYENARLSRQGGPGDQLSALSDYWTAATLAQVQSYLQGP